MLCDHLEGWAREGGREAQEGGDMGIYVKQLYSNKDILKKLVQNLAHSRIYNNHIIINISCVLTICQDAK